jgi:hypothetical protein
MPGIFNFSPLYINNFLNTEIATFKGKVTDSTVDLNLTKLFTNYDSIKECTDKIIKSINEVLSNKSLTSLGKNIKNYEQSRDIKRIFDINKPLAQRLFILRHKLLFQILIITHALMSNKSLFDEVYKKFPTYNATYNADFLSEINNLKIGCWGSLNITSDIDLGFQYASRTNRKPGILRGLVEIFEDMFLILTEKTTLNFDIEPYCDLMYMDIKGESLFHCNTEDFSVEDLLLPTTIDRSKYCLMDCIGASIIRNYMQYTLDKGFAKDIRKYKREAEINETSKNQESKMIDDFDFIKTCTEFGVLMGSSYSADLRTFLSSIFTENAQWIAGSKQIAKNYMLHTYMNSRNQYYKFIEIAEQMLIDNPSILTDATTLPDKNIRLKLMIVIALALNFRAESYVSPSTVTHVVRIMQAKNNNNVECNSGPYPTRSPSCALNNIGYLMSIMEQAGYIMRFRLTYCDDKNNPSNDCIHKVEEKYMARLIDGLRLFDSNITKDQLNTIQSLLLKISFNRKPGGTRIRKTKNKHIKKYTKKYKKSMRIAKKLIKKTNNFLHK